jgi:predicted PurR-regulated permease PerM
MVSFLVLVGIIVVCGILFYRVMASFLLPLFLAAVLVVMFRPVHNWCTVRLEGRRRLAALLTTLAVVFAVIVPAITIVSFAAVEATALLVALNDQSISAKVSSLRSSLGLERPCGAEIRYIESSLEDLRQQHVTRLRGEDSEELALANLVVAVSQLEEKIRELGHGDKAATLVEVQSSIRAALEEAPGSFAYRSAIQQAAHSFRAFQVDLSGGGFRFWLTNLANPSESEVQQMTSRAFSSVSNWLPSLGGATGTFLFRIVLGFVIIVVAVFFFLADGPRMFRTLMRLSPLDDRYENELYWEFDRVSRAVVVATLLSAVVQGLLGGFGFWLAGVTPVFLLTLLTTVLALIPFVGATAVWLPVSLWLLFAEQRYLAAGLLAVYGAAVVSSADNLIKPLVLHGQSNLHPLLALLSVLGGVQALGPVGILIGPMVVVFLQTLLNILHREMTNLERRPVLRRPPQPLPSILSLRLRGLRLTYAPPRKVSRNLLKERAE